MNNDNLLLLVDGSSYFYRAFHALPPLSNSKGQATGAVYGVVNMIKRLLKEYPTEQVAVVFDAKGKTFRNDLYPEYKANRPPMPDDLRSQFEPMVDILDAMGLPLLIVEGVEADDVIGTLAKTASRQGLTTVISTGDKDMAQLVDEHVTLINTMSNTSMDPAGVLTKFGVGPELIIDYLSLIGDKSDNVPGVPKVGPKTAVKWLNAYGSLTGVIEHADDIGGKVGENLRDSLSFLPLSHQLITIKDDVELTVTLSDLLIQSPDNQRLLQLFNDLEFRPWAKALQAPVSAPVENNYSIIGDDASFTTLLEQLQQASLFAIDSETTSIDASQAQLVGLSFATKAHQAAYIPLAHNEDSPQLAIDDVLTRLKPLLEDETCHKVGQNLKYDSQILAHYGIELKGISHDTMLESYLLDATGRHDMDSLALKYLNHQTIHFEDIAGKGAKQRRFDDIPIREAAPYAAEDADITLQLHQVLWPKLQQNSRLCALYQEIELPLLTVLAKVEATGVLIDVQRLAQMGGTVCQRMDVLEQDIYAIAGSVFNLNSPKQLQSILYDTLALPVLQKTPKGQPSTAEAVLHELAYDHPIAASILEFRSLSKLNSTYIEALPKCINPKTGRVHTSYNQAVTATGRLSSSEPNLQNIPVRSELGRQIRTAFIAPQGYKIVAADYSQIELRIMAHLSQDPGLLKAFANDWDVHRATAAEVFSVALDEVSDEQRRRSKAINFGLIYGMSSFGLAKQLDIPRKAAQEYIDLYFERFAGVKDYMEATREKAHVDGYVETLYGRRLYLPQINARNVMQRKAAERTAINAPMQGTAADIIKKAMLAIDQWQQETALKTRLIMQVHDELVFEVLDADIEKACQQICCKMEQAVDLSVPLRVSIGVGDNWEEAH